jgi:hypothetical protein
VAQRFSAAIKTPGVKPGRRTLKKLAKKLGVPHVSPGLRDLGL